MQRVAAIALAALVAFLPALARAEAFRTILTFDDLDGWADDDHASALAVFRTTCGDMAGADWAALCALAKTGPEPRAFFEMFFRPVLIEDGARPLVTGYFEPEIAGARKPDARFRYPVYRKPPELTEGTLWLDRRSIETGGTLAGRGLEIAWVDDPAALFYMQVQGSGRIRLRDGSVLRLGYAASNGREYLSPGEELARRGVYEPHQVSARVVGNWVRRNPTAGAELLRSSPSYVFFREIKGLGADAGPKGAMNRAITAGRSVAIDPAFVPLGAPVWVEKSGVAPMQRLMIAQDTGSAIKGAQRADIFVGSGAEAGQSAAKMRDRGRLILLVPIEMAYAMAAEAR